MMPVLGECKAAKHASEGSILCAVDASMCTKSVTPLAWALVLIASRVGTWLSWVATINLPQRLCPMPFFSRYA